MVRRNDAREKASKTAKKKKRGCIPASRLPRLSLSQAAHRAGKKNRFSILRPPSFRSRAPTKIFSSPPLARL
ncbi:hypothetical protein V8C34DRAFT_293532 [Trichoderma compactum]